MGLNSQNGITQLLVIFGLPAIVVAALILITIVSALVGYFT